MNLKTKQSLAIIFSIGGSIGTIGTALLARKAARMEALYDFKGDNINKKPFKEQFNILLPLYLPAILVGTLTVGSIVGSTVMSHKAQASIMSMAVLADRGWKKYKNQVKSTLGLDVHDDILQGIAKDRLKSIPKPNTDPNDVRELYYEETVGFFKADPADVAFAYAELNEILNTDYRNQLSETFDFVSIGKFLRLANADILDKTISDDALDMWGWTMDYLCDVHDGRSWIHIKFVDEKTDDNVVPYKVVTWVEEPILLDEKSLYDMTHLSLDGVTAEDFDGTIHKKYKLKEYVLRKDKKK